MAVSERARSESHVDLLWLSGRCQLGESRPGSQDGLLGESSLAADSGRDRDCRAHGCGHRDRE